MARPSMRNRQLVPTWTVLHLIGECPRSARELANELGVTVRSIYRDLEALEEAQFPLYNDRNDDGTSRWQLLNPKAVPVRRAA